MASPNPAKQRMAKVRLAELMAHPGGAFVVHYACQSLEQTSVLGSPRVASIVVRALDGAEVHAFSIHQERELMGLRLEQAWPAMDALELAMLDRYFRFVARHAGARFVHWRMNNIVYGFQAIEHRYRVLGGKPIEIAPHQRYDLAQMLVDLYGTDYVASPHLEKLSERNGLPVSGFIAGRQEPEHFAGGDFAGVLRSTMTKTALMAAVVQRAHDRKLRTDASFWSLNAGGVREAVEHSIANPVYAVASIAIAGLGSFFGALRWLWQ